MKVSEHPAGTPCWIDVSTPDIDRTIAFYEGLFGWSAHRLPEPEAGGYFAFRQDGVDVAGGGPTQPGGLPPMWTTYVATADAVATAAAIRAGGGTVLVEPFDVPLGAGRMLVAQDPTAAVFCAWQAGSHRGVGLAGEPVSLAWSELVTTDAATAATFYAGVCGWESELLGADDPDASFVYRIQKLGGAQVAGIMQADPAWGDVASHWSTYFAVADTDGTCDAARALGGSVRSEPQDTPYGRMAALEDPVGATFSVIALPG